MPRRVRRHWKALTASASLTAALALTTTFTLGGFSASIQNNTSTFSSAVVAFSEVAGATTCYNTGSAPGTVTSSNTNTTCTINMLGNATDQVAGNPVTQSVTVSNTGNHTPSTASLVVGTCTAAGAGDNGGYTGSDTSGFCGDVEFTLQNNTTGFCMFPYSASAACSAPTSSNTLSSVAGDTFNVGAGTPSGAAQYGLSIPTGGGVSYTVTVEMGASVTNADQGLAATVPFIWSISQ